MHLTALFARSKKVLEDSFLRQEGVVFPEKRAPTQQKLGENCRERRSIKNEEPSVSMGQRTKLLE